MKRIGYVLGQFPVLSETFVGNEIRAVIAQGLDVVPFAFETNQGDSQPIDRLLATKVKTIPSVGSAKTIGMWVRNPIAAVKALSFILHQRGLPILSLIRSAGQLASLAKQNQCHHLHAHFALHTAATAIAASKLAGIRVSFVGHGYDVYATPADLSLKLAHSNFAVAVCADMKKHFEALSPSTSVYPIACGIDPVRYPFTPVSNTHCNGRLLFIGRLTEKKGLHTLLTAMSAIKPADRPGLDIVGTGHLDVQLKTLCDRLSLNDHVKFLGNKTSEWIIENGANYLALCAPFCKAKNGDRDTGPLVVKEAMALGLPVITTAFMGCKEMLDEHSGLLVSPNRVDQLQHAILRVQKMQEPDRLSLLISARDRLEKHFTSTISGERLVAAVKGTL